MRRAILGASCALALAGVCGSARSAVFEQANVQSYTYSRAETPTADITSYGADAVTASSFTHLLDSEAHSIAAPNGGLQALATDNEVTSAAFTNAQSGSINFSGSTAVDVNVSSGAALASILDFEYASYAFAILDPERITVEYNLVDSVSSGGVEYYISADHMGRLTTNSFGSMSYELSAGSYVFSLVDQGYGDSIGQSGIGSKLASYNDFVNFSISGAPEPSTWALVIAGVGMVGAALRLGRRTVQVT